MRLILTDDDGRVFLLVNRMEDIDLTDPAEAAVLERRIDSAVMDMEAFDDPALAGPRAIVSDTHHRLTVQLVERTEPCEGCAGLRVDGVRWPAAPDGDTSRDWVERCDTCRRYPDDQSAAEAVAAEIGWHVEEAPLANGHVQPYVDANHDHAPAGAR